MRVAAHPSLFRQRVLWRARGDRQAAGGMDGEMKMRRIKSTGPQLKMSKRSERERDGVRCSAWRGAAAWSAARASERARWGWLAGGGGDAQHITTTCIYIPSLYAARRPRFRRRARRAFLRAAPRRTLIHF